MATSGSWSATRKVPDIEHIHKWEIEDFDLYMMRENGMIKSNNFSIPGVPGEFYMAVAVKTEWIEGRRSFIEHMPTRLFGGAAKPDLEIQIEFYFSVILKYKCKGMVRAAGKLEITKEGAGTQLGEFGDPHTHCFEKNGAAFRPLADLYCTATTNDQNDVKATGFYTTGDTGRLKMVAKITIPGKVFCLGGSEVAEEVKQSKLFDFQPFLFEGTHSDIVLKCGGSRICCHKVILAARYQN